MKKLAAALILSASSLVWAQSVPTTAVPAPLQMALGGGMVVEKSFPGPSGMTGWVMKSRDGQFSVVFTTADGQHLIAGAVFDASGTNLTALLSEKHIPKPDYAEFWPKLEKSAYAVQGATGRNVKSVVYAFMDPNCVFCHLAWKAFLPYEKLGLQVRWIPVGILREDSAGKAAAILQAADPAAALERHKKTWTPQDPASGIAPVTPNAETRSKLEANVNLMREMKLTGTPALIWKQRDGSVMLRAGMPRLPDIPGITGLPLQPNNDPALRRFE